MSVELGMVPVIVRRSALREAGIEEMVLASKGVVVADEHLLMRGFMSSNDATLFEEELLASGVASEAIAAPGSTWLTFARCNPPDWPICSFSYAFLTEAGPGEIAEIPSNASRRPVPRPWASWPPA